MTQTQRSQAENIFNVLDSEEFGYWYGLDTQSSFNTDGRFELYITATDKTITKEMILEDIVRMFKI